MTTIGHLPFLQQVAVGEQERKRLVGFDTYLVFGQHIGTVEKIGDAPETFRLTLSAIGAIGHVQAFQCRVIGRADASHQSQFKFVEFGFKQ